MTIFSKIIDDRRSILFLLRTYNDIDHIVPVIWKASTSGLRVFYVFVGQRYADDYRVNFISESGAEEINNRLIRGYYKIIRPIIAPRVAKRFVDVVIACTVGLFLIKIYKVSVVANEWSGPFGREMAEYYLRPATLMKLPVYSLPHGYHTWRNNLFNSFLKQHWNDHGTLPDFSNRAYFTQYVVQDDNVKRYYLTHGMYEDKLAVLGSARFCEQWSSINLHLLEKLEDYIEPLSSEKYIKVVFFLPHWAYNVERKRTIDLLLRISRVEGVAVVVKLHTRGTSALSVGELEAIREKQTISIAGDSGHSPLLIRRADAVINVGSSIGFEALRQEKPVCNPTYLHANSTIFDDSGVTFDANNEEDVIGFLMQVREGKFRRPSQDTVTDFFRKYILGDRGKPDILEEYISLLTSQARCK